MSGKSFVRLAAVAAVALGYGVAARAAVLFSDNFESYNNGQLATTDASTANPGPNGGPGNPWWAPPNNNGLVTGAVNSVTPHSGTKMVIGAAAADFDQDVVNLAYRAGGGAALTGNFALDFWFYDTNGKGDANSTGYGELGNYSSVPTNTDYATGHPLNGTITQRAILGTVNNTGADLNVYQARVLGGAVTVGTSYNSTYINTTAQRSVGWHEGRIVVGPQLAGGGNLFDFYIDNMTTPVGEATTTTGNGINSLVLDTQLAGNASTMNYFDDVTVSSTPTPEPASLSVIALAGCAVLGRRSRRKA